VIIKEVMIKNNFEHLLLFKSITFK